MKNIFANSLSLVEYLVKKINGYGYGGNSIRNEVKSLSKKLKSGLIFIDVGGNKGLYTQELLKVYDPQEIHIFEPSAENVKILNNKFGEKQNIIINNVGLSDTSREGILYSDFPGSGLGSLTKRRVDHFDLTFSENEKIKLIRFDHYWVDESKIIDLFKMDVEGHEYDVLKGIGEKIHKIRFIQFEFGGCNIDTRIFFQDFWYFFKEYNFHVYRITPFGLIRVDNYTESQENFTTTNYLCFNANLK